ncbi:MAG TPA: lysophospholipid acyltransferase family protein [Verrucomicrobiae bacterium]|nr:lysophospholipid acyltransferase family protein [Verrucomicrobiae bacterium]
MIRSSFFAGLIAGGARLLAGPTVRWIGSKPERRQRVYFANHTSHLDFVVLWSVLPPDLRRRTRPVAAKDYWQSGLRRRIAVNVFHAVLVERGARHPADAASAASQLESARFALDVLLDALDKRYSLILFPEGTRGSGEGISAFKSGIYHLWCKRPDVEFVPVHLSNLNRILPKGEFLPVPVISHVVFGPPLQLDETESKESFLKKAHEALDALGHA